MHVSVLFSLASSGSWRAGAEGAGQAGGLQKAEEAGIDSLLEPPEECGPADIFISCQ